MSGRILRAAAAVTATACAALAAPALAGAATVNGAGVLTYAAAPGQENLVVFSQTGPAAVHVESFDDDPITASGTCTSDGADGFDCTGITSVVADGGDRGDLVDATSLTDIRATLDGSAGSDAVGGGGAADLIRGGDGDDNLFGGGGADDVSGGAGAFDSVFVEGSGDPAPPLSVTLDDLPNDGTPGQGANIRSDVEDVEADSFNTTTDEDDGPVTIVGSAASNNLFADSPGNVTGGPGNDSLFGSSSDDTMNARDGFADRVQCGPGDDTANVDTLDAVGADCEHVNSVDVGNATEDKPPTVAFVAPAQDSAKVASGTGTTLEATASDDKGVAKVQFLDDEQIICEDTTAPYTCDYTPTGSDVGRNTLSAVAIDTSQQTATARRTVRVSRFAPRSVSLKVKPKRDRKNPRRFTATGRVNLPVGVTAGEGCSGRVAIQVKAGKKTISNRRAKVRKDCTFKRRVTFNDPGRLPKKGVLKFTARYQGNSVLTTKKSKTRKVRTK